MKDLDHADWCLFTQTRLLESVNPEIICEIARYPDGTKILFASNITEIDILNLKFLTNTDQNNNYLYLENFSVYESKNPTKPISIPGLNNIMIELYRQSDYDAYIKGQITHNGFTTQNFLFSNFKNNGLNIFNDQAFGSDINSFIDLYTSLIPFSPNTKPGKKLYSITLNPDNPLAGLSDNIVQTEGNSGSAGILRNNIPPRG